ncbi:MAG: glycerol-3-phosphate dehydrogenase/oxidase [Nocardioidaceae bacterium]|nr:glycerol-3-phosphate dehydrogenase/oxidase [Nocardioidaceae bacterium]
MTGPLPGAEARIGVGIADLPERTDLLVVGLGVTGAGVALDAASRGLDVVAVDAFDLAWGTSRWSSKLVHGGLRYLANLQLDVAWESAVERDILMRRTAPHLTHALPMLIALTPDTGRLDAALVRIGTAAGDLLRRGARTPRQLLPGPRRISAAETTALAPEVRRRGLRGAVLSFDGQLEDDARLVVALARTVASYGARVRTRTRVVAIGDGHVDLRDETTGEVRRIEARAVVNAAGVWAGDVVDGIRLQPSRGTHLVLRAGTLPGLRTALMVPVPGTRARYVFVLPQPDGRRYVGLTDVPAPGPVPDVPTGTEEEIAFLLGVVGTVLDVPLTRDDVAGTYAGLRPLLESDDTTGATADLSRKHAVVTGQHGVVTVVGGKLTTYRRMAEDAVDAALAAHQMSAGPCRTRRLPLLGAASREQLDGLGGSPRLVRRFGTEAALVLDTARRVTGMPDAELLAPVADGDPATFAELVFAVTHEGARTVEDLLERRTRVALVPADAERARPVAERVLDVVAASTTF